MKDHRIGRGNTLAGTGPGKHATQSLEFGNIIFLLNNPDFVKNSRARTTIDDLNAYFKKNGVAVPKSTITPEEYRSFEITPTLEPDGTINGTGTYETLDVGWADCLWNDRVTYENGPYYGLDSQGNANPLVLPGSTYVPVSASSRSGSQSITVGLLSDWGTGDPDGYSNAVNVVTALDGKSPDYMIHLGDVYYSGTPSVEPPNSGWFYHYHTLGEESANLVAPWPSALDGRSFTMNSNHEMYSGAFGLFTNALTGSGPFSAQGTNSVFVIQVGDWTILGLDTAYDSPYHLYMYGWIGPDQVAWIETLKLDAAKTIVLTHHTGLDYDGSYDSSDDAQQSYQSLWGALAQALGGDPYAWYWGHVHNGIVYNTGTTTVTVPTSNGSGTRKSQTYCRCLGYGALPFAQAPGLVAMTNQLPWYVKDGTASDPAFNGYATLTFDLNTSGVCQTITESFWDCDPAGTEPLWTNTLFQAAS